jgi:hypothetical protein
MVLVATLLDLGEGVAVGRPGTRAPLEPEARQRQLLAWPLKSELAGYVTFAIGSGLSQAYSLGAASPQTLVASPIQRAIPEPRWPVSFTHGITDLSTPWCSS